MMQAALLPITLGIVGLVVGSFLGLVSLRVPVGLDIVAGRSRCGSCGETLSPLRLIPVLSYVWSRGRCVDCGASIPARYPLLEITAAAIGVVAGLSQTGLVTAGLVAIAGWHWLISLTLYVEHRRVPSVLGGSLLVSTMIAVALVLANLPLGR